MGTTDIMGFGLALVIAALFFYLAVESYVRRRRHRRRWGRIDIALIGLMVASLIAPFATMWIINNATADMGVPVPYAGPEQRQQS